MPTTTIPKRVINGLPLTEHHSHQYEYGSVLFVKTFGFWHAQAPDGSMTPPLFTIHDAVTWARSNGWVLDVDTCTWCSGHGYLRSASSYFDLSVCINCDGTGINPDQPVAEV